MKPTKIVENTGDNISAQMAAKASCEVVITPDTVVLDAREAFEFATGHIPHSKWIDINEFRNDRSRFKGALPGDLLDFTRRLSRLGIDPATPVVVIGNGRSGTGKDGRLAWLLHYVGVTDVHVANLAYFKTKLITDIDDPKPAKSWWDPKPQDDEVVAVNDLTPLLVKRDPQTWLIDVRPASDYLGQSGFGKAFRVPEMNAVNVPWTEFIDEFGRPNSKIFNTLLELGVQRDQQIILLSAQGMESSVALIALDELGFKKVAHLPGGLEEFLATWSAKVKEKKPHKSHRKRK